MRIDSDFIGIKTPKKSQFTRRVFISYTDMFGSKGPGTCNICGDLVNSPLRSFCSKYCKETMMIVSARYSRDSIRDRKMAMNPICEICNKRYSQDMDHIMEIQDGGHEFDLRNLQALCNPCHKKKTKNEIAKRRIKGMKKEAIKQIEGICDNPNNVYCDCTFCKEVGKLYE